MTRVINISAQLFEVLLAYNVITNFLVQDSSSILGPHKIKCANIFFFAQKISGAFAFV